MTPGAFRFRQYAHAARTSGFLWVRNPLTSSASISLRRWSSIARISASRDSQVASSDHLSRPTISRSAERSDPIVQAGIHATAIASKAATRTMPTIRNQRRCSISTRHPLLEFRPSLPLVSRSHVFREEPCVAQRSAAGCVTGTVSAPCQITSLGVSHLCIKSGDMLFNYRPVHVLQHGPCANDSVAGKRWGCQEGGWCRCRGAADIGGQHTWLSLRDRPFALIRGHAVGQWQTRGMTSLAPATGNDSPRRRRSRVDSGTKAAMNRRSPKAVAWRGAPSSSGQPRRGAGTPRLQEESCQPSAGSTRCVEDSPFPPERGDERSEQRGI